MAKWIEFELAPTPPGQKTQRFVIKTKDQGQKLGEVRWWGAWRKYCFFPSYGTVFEETCMKDIARFLEQVTTEYKGRTKNSREN